MNTKFEVGVLLRQEASGAAANGAASAHILNENRFQIRRLFIEGVHPRNLMIPEGEDSELITSVCKNPYRSRAGLLTRITSVGPNK